LQLYLYICFFSDLNLNVPPTDGLPAPWWDAEADKSLLAGTYKHGYERYNMMRLDPELCFLSRCGPPDSSELEEEEQLILKRTGRQLDEDSKMAEDDEDR
jgi:chromodomain-helicase-DNA-binding protein 7